MMDADVVPATSSRLIGEVCRSLRPSGVWRTQVQHLRPPAAYLADNWPLRHAALSADGTDVAVAGARGLALYNRRSARWRLFGDVSQERCLAVKVRQREAASAAARALSHAWAPKV